MVRFFRDNRTNPFAFCCGKGQAELSDRSLSGADEALRETTQEAVSRSRNRSHPSTRDEKTSPIHRRTKGSRRRRECARDALPREKLSRSFNRKPPGRGRRPQKLPSDHQPILMQCRLSPRRQSTSSKSRWPTLTLTSGGEFGLHRDHARLCRARR
jgi:hypothetical protein